MPVSRDTICRPDMVLSFLFACLATTGVAVRVGLDGIPANFVGVGVADKTQAGFAIAGEKAAALPPAAPADALMETNMSALEQLQDVWSQKQLEEIFASLHEEYKYVRNVIFDLQWTGPEGEVYPHIPQVWEKFFDHHLNKPVRVRQVPATKFNGKQRITITPSKGYSQTLVPGAFLVEEEGPNGKNLNYYAVEKDGSNCPKNLIPYLSQEDMKALTAPKAKFLKTYEKQAIAVIKYKDADKLADSVKQHLGGVDNAKYKKPLSDDHWKKGAIAIQFDGDTPDFYPIDGGTYSEQYNKITKEILGKKNKALHDKLSDAILGDKTSNSWEYLQKKPVSMYQLSDLGKVACKATISKQDVIRIEEPWGTQDKKKGVHAFLVEETKGGEKSFYMVNGDGRDLPIAYNRKED